MAEPYHGIPCDWFPEGILGGFNSPVPVDCWDWPVAVSTVTFGAERSTLTMGSSSK